MTSVEHHDPSARTASAQAAARSWRGFVDGLLVFAVLAVHGAWPVPDVNEPHYVLKAQHFWQPHTMERDVFLSSRDSHVVFFAVFGWLPTVVPLETAVWCGRVAAWLLVAWGWRRLSYAVAPRFGLAALTAAAALAANRYGQMAGEWFVGGIEAKSLAYGFAFAGLADVLLDKWNRGLVWLGFAAALHVLVGGWTLVAVGGVWLLDGSRRPALVSILPGLAAAALLSTAGVVPGLFLNRGVPSEVVAAAEQVYVEMRISHHLDPKMFVPQFGPRLAAVYAAWLVLCLANRPDERLRRVRHFASGAAILVAVGLAIGWLLPPANPLRGALLKYYWFRLADVAGPAALALEVGALAATARLAWGRFAAASLLFAGGGWHLASTVYVRAHTPLARGENLYSGENLPGWRDACRWIRENTPSDALVLSPKSFQTFKWYAARAEYANWKDVPQDSASLVEWKRRLDRLYPREVQWVNYLDQKHVREVCRDYQVDYVVAYVLPPLDLPRVYSNNDFAVYQVPRDERAASATR